jgi:hypothetical protein
MPRPARWTAYDRQAELDLQAERHADAAARAKVPLPPPPITPTTRRMQRFGFTNDEITLGLIQQAAQAKAGMGVRPLHAILTGQPQRTNPNNALAELAPRQLSRRGRYGQAALLADQQALQERDPGRAAVAREASNALKILSGRPQQVEFDFFMANTSHGHQYTDTILQRLDATGASRVERDAALATLTLIARYQGWQSHECTKTGVELARMRGVDKGNMTRTLALLERIGAITRTRRGTTKTICVTPEGVYRGAMDKHAETVERYKADVVVPLRQKAARKTAESPSAA